MKINNIQWFNYMNFIIIPQNICSRFSHYRIHVDGIYHFNIFMLSTYTLNCLKHVLHGLTKIFPTMGCN